MKAVILAGGGGTRLWPLSTEKKPKQFQSLVGDRTMIEDTISRLDFLELEDIYISINILQKPILKSILPKFPDKNIILEPALRDTCACIGLAAYKIDKYHPGEVMAVIYADHFIENKKIFQKKLKLAEKIADKEQTLNIIEVVASSPNTNYGYVKVGKLIDKENEVYKLNKFIEKPDLSTAKKFVKSGNFLWNTGYYVWKTSVLKEAYKKILPGTANKLQKIADNMNTVKEEQTLKKIYPTIEKTSIDYGIMEKVDPNMVRIIKADFGWSDIGNFEALWNLQKRDKNNNVIKGNVQTHDVTGSLIYGYNNKELKVIGLKNMIIIDSEQGTFICEKQRSPEIKRLTAKK